MKAIRWGCTPAATSVAVRGNGLRWARLCASLILVFLVVTLILTDLVQVVDLQPHEEEQRRVWKRRLRFYRTLIFNLFQRTTIRTMVVVWQIVTQVWARVCGEIARGPVRTAEYTFNVRDESIILPGLHFGIADTLFPSPLQCFRPTVR